MSLSLATLRLQTQRTLGDLGEVDFLDANIDMGINWALVELARITDHTRTIRTFQVPAGQSSVSVAPALAVLNVVLLP